MRSYKRRLQEIPATLRELLKFANKQRLAKLTGLSREHLSRIAHGHVQRISFDELQKLIETLQSDAFFIVFDDLDALDEALKSFAELADARKGASYEDILFFLQDSEKTGLLIHQAIVEKNYSLTMLAMRMQKLFAPKAKFLNLDPFALAIERLKNIIIGSPINLDELLFLSSTLNVPAHELVALEGKAVAIFRELLKRSRAPQVKKTLKKIANILHVE